MTGFKHGLTRSLGGGEPTDGERRACMEEKTEREKTRARSGTAVGAYRFCGEEGTGGQLSDCVQRISSGALRLLAVCGSPLA